MDFLKSFLCTRKHDFGGIVERGTGRGSIFGNERSLKRQNRRSWGRVVGNGSGSGSGTRNSAGSFDPSEEEPKVNDFHGQSPEKVSPEGPNFDRVGASCDSGFLVPVWLD